MNFRPRMTGISDSFHDETNDPVGFCQMAARFGTHVVTIDPLISGRFLAWSN